MSGFKIQNYPCKVLFNFDSRDSLKEVYIEPEESPMAFPYVKDQFLSSLTENYGSPQHSAESVRSGDAVKDKWEWLLPKTTISLTYIHENSQENEKFNLLQLNYQSRQKAADL